MDNETPKTEREKYVEGLQVKISKAYKAKRFKEADEGKMIIELLQEQSNVIVKRLGGTTHMNDHQSYVYDLGQLHFAQKIINLINVEASKDVTKLQESLDAAESGE